MREKQTTVYLCAAREQDAAALTGSAAALLYLERELTACGFRVQIGSGGAFPTGQCHLALQLATTFGGVGCVVYHPVTNDWERYRQSWRLAVLLEEQARHYRLLCRREVQSGAAIPWLQRVQVPAALAVCNLPDGDIWQHLSLIEAQTKGYAQAVKLWLREQEQTEADTAKGAEHETLF